MSFFDYLDKNYWGVTLWIVIALIAWIAHLMEKSARPPKIEVKK